MIYFSRNPKDLSVSYFKFVGQTLLGDIEGWNGFLRLFLSEKSKLTKLQLANIIGDLDWGIQH